MSAPSVIGARIVTGRVLQGRTSSAVEAAMPHFALECGAAPEIHLQYRRRAMPPIAEACAISIAGADTQLVTGLTMVWSSRAIRPAATIRAGRARHATLHYQSIQLSQSLQRARHFHAPARVRSALPKAIVAHRSVAQPSARP